MNPNPQDDHVERLEAFEKVFPAAASAVSSLDPRLATLAGELADMRKLVQDDEPAKEPGLFEGFKAQDLHQKTELDKAVERLTRPKPIVAGTELSEGELTRMAQGGPGQLVMVPANTDIRQLIPGTALTIAAAERLENAAQNVVAVAQLYAEEDCTDEYGHRVSRIPPELRSSLAKIKVVLAGPGPVALDRRPNSVETINDPELHERALIEARAREAARTGFDPKVLAQSDGYEEAQHAHLQDVAQAFEEGKTQGYEQGQKTGYADAEHAYDTKLEKAKRDSWDSGHGMGCFESRHRLLGGSLWSLVKAWWKYDSQAAARGEVGGINTEPSSHWKNNAK